MKRGVIEVDNSLIDLFNASFFFIESILHPGEQDRQGGVSGEDGGEPQDAAGGGHRGQGEPASPPGYPAPARGESGQELQLSAAGGC